MENKLEGCLIGAAIGDSVGLPYDVVFNRKKTIWTSR